MVVHEIRLPPKRKFYIKIKNLKSWKLLAEIATTKDFLNVYIKIFWQKSTLYLQYQDEGNKICRKLLFKVFLQIVHYNL